jgi:hypothetical protein
MTKTLYLMHRSGTAVLIPVDSAEVRNNPVIPGGFNLTYVSDTTTVLFLRTENYDAAILRDDS